MPVEQRPPSPQPGGKEKQAVIVDALFLLWEQLPPKQQAITALVMIDRRLNSGEQPWVRAELATRWQVPLAEIADAFPLVDIRPEDLEQLRFSPDDLAQLEAEDLQELAQTLRDNSQEWVRAEVKKLVTNRLEENKLAPRPRPGK